MKSLFRRLFLSFWASLVAILLLGVGVTLAVTSAREHALDGVSSLQLTAQARQAAQASRTALAEWAAGAESAHPTLRIYLVDRQGRELRGLALPARLQNWVDDNLAQAVDQWETERALPASSPFRSGPASADSWWNVPAVVTDDGTPFFMLFLPFDSSAYEVLGVPYVLLLLLGCAVLVSGLVCWVVARHISAPVLKVQAGLRALARGELEARMGPAAAQRRDELGALAGDFDLTATRLQELVAAQELLLRDVSHELRTPLTRLRLALDLARRGGDGQGAQLDRIERECGRLDALTGQVLKLARLRAPPPGQGPGHGPSRGERLDLARVVDDTIADLAYEAQAGGKTVDWHAPADALPLHGIRADLASLLENIVRNALRFTPEGGSVRVVLERTSPPSDSEAEAEAQAVLSVLDRGPGIAPQHLDQVFSPFFQSDAARTPGHTGVGLGLSIAQLVAQRHGGGIELRNREGGGLRVAVTLPLAAPVPTPRTPAPDRPGRPA